MGPKDDSHNPFGKWIISGGNFPKEWQDDPEMVHIMHTLIEASIISARLQEELDDIMSEITDNKLGNMLLNDEREYALIDGLVENMGEYPQALDWIMGAYRRGQEQGWN